MILFITLYITVIINCCDLRDIRAPVYIIHDPRCSGDLNAPDGHVNEIAMCTMYIMLWVYVYDDMSNDCDIYARRIVV